MNNLKEIPFGMKIEKSDISDLLIVRNTIIVPEITFYIPDDYKENAIKLKNNYSRR